jgi:hypothetical protein
VNYEDQAHYHRRAAPVQWPAKKAMDDKFRPSNMDMWQRFNDCILCDQKSIPNSQGVLLQTCSRNILVGFHKTLQVYKFEAPPNETRSHLHGIHQGSNGQEKLPHYLHGPEPDEPLIIKSYLNGVKNYSWVQSEPPVPGSSHYLANGLGPMGSFLSKASNLLTQ